MDAGTVGVRRAGLYGWLVEVGTGERAADLHRHLTRLHGTGRLPGVVDLVPGARTVLLDGGPPGLSHADLLALLDRWQPEAGHTSAPARLVEIPVRYQGADLAEVARRTGCTEAEVVSLHTGTELTVAFCGFSPGFGYLVGQPARLRVPRLAEPRTAVPAGAVALAEEYTGIYPRRSPGGWRIIGYTGIELWNERWDPPALLTPGTRVRFLADGS